MSKYLHIADLIKCRIERGDYGSNVPLPGAQSLAVETACSYLTVRQALQKLTADGVLKQLQNGRLVAAPKPASEAVALKVGLLRPVWAVGQWERLIYNAARRNGCNFKVLYYNHPKDEALYEAFDFDFDLLFTSIEVEDELLLRKLERNNSRVVTLFQDFTELGVRCLDGVPPSQLVNLVEYLAKLGHKRIDFVSAGVATHVVRDRVKAWRFAIDSLGLEGREIACPCESFEQQSPAVKRHFDALLAGGFAPASASVCLNVDVVYGVMRSLYDRGLRIPDDVSIACFGDATRAAISIPSITCFSGEDYSPEVNAIFDFYLGRGGDPARLMYRSNSAKLIVGESTGPCKKERGK